MQQRRVVPKFDEEENKLLNKNMRNTVQHITNQIHQCENSLSSLSYQKTNNEIQRQLKENMKLFLTTKFNDFTRHFKYNQEIYIRKYKELCGEDFEKENNIEINNSDNFLLRMEKYDNLKSRDSDLNQLLDSMNNLASTFKDLKNLVVEQGTILDRIDYNIDIACEHVKKGKKNLIKADENYKGKCFRNAIIILLIIIFTECCLLLFKFL